MASKVKKKKSWPLKRKKGGGGIKTQPVWSDIVPGAARMAWAVSWAGASPAVGGFLL